MLSIAATALAVASSLAGHQAPVQPAPAPASTQLSAGSNRFTWGGHSWRCFDGTGALGQHWRCANVSAGSTLQLKIPSDSASGVHLFGSSRYGTWTVTFRITPGTGSRYAILLMPDNAQRPEVDFAEGDDKYATRQTLTGTYHPKPGCIDCIHLKTNGDFTTWHTLGVTVAPGGITWTKDGAAWAHLARSVPGPMHLNIQTARVGSGGLSTLEVRSITTP